MAARIFVEGFADRHFIHQYMEYIGLEVPEIETLGGGNLNNFKTGDEVLFQRAKSDKVKVLVIIDADSNDATRICEIKKFISKYGVKEDQLFLIPTNDGSNGELEDLLFSLIPEKNRSVLDCLDAVSKCVEQAGFVGMSKKDRVFQYVFSQLTKEQKEQRGKHAGEANREYRNSLIWSLDSETLNPLKAFLKKHLA